MDAVLLLLMMLLVETPAGVLLLLLFISFDFDFGFAIVAFASRLSKMKFMTDLTCEIFLEKSKISRRVSTRVYTNRRNTKKIAQKLETIPIWQKNHSGVFGHQSCGNLLSNRVRCDMIL